MQKVESAEVSVGPEPRKGKKSKSSEVLSLMEGVANGCSRFSLVMLAFQNKEKRQHLSEEVLIASQLIQPTDTGCFNIVSRPGTASFKELSLIVRRLACARVDVT